MKLLYSACHGNGIFSMFCPPKYCRVSAMANSSCQAHILAYESYRSSASEIYLAPLKMEAHWLQLPIELDVVEFTDLIASISPN